MNIVISFLGTTLDQRGGRNGVNRWHTWRPSVALAIQDDLKFDRYYLIYQPAFEPLMKKNSGRYPSVFAVDRSDPGCDRDGRSVGF